MFRCININLIFRFFPKNKSSIFGLRKFSHSICFPSGSKLETCEDEFDWCKSSYEVDDYANITDGDFDKLKLLKLCSLEVDLLSKQGEEVPSILGANQWRKLIQFESKADRLQYLHFLWRSENRRKIRRLEFLAKQQYITYLKQNRMSSTNGPIIYNLMNNTVFLRLNETRLKSFLNYKLFQASMFGHEILIDVSYEEFMSNYEIKQCAKQIVYLWSENRNNLNPFHIIFCNLKCNSKMLLLLKALFLNVEDDNFPFFYTKDSYLELYPKEKLVYLTPHCRNELYNFDHDSVYVIGAMVDCLGGDPLSYRKAAKDNLRSVRLPLDRYLNWHAGAKSLTLNQVLAIMSELKDGASWSFALRHVPSRKLAGDELDDFQATKKVNQRKMKEMRDHLRRARVLDLFSTRQ